MRDSSNVTVVVYHRTTPEAARLIQATGKFISREGHDVFVSDRLDAHAVGYGDSVVALRVPSSWLRLDDEFPNGERHYALDARKLNRHHILTANPRGQIFQLDVRKIFAWSPKVEQTIEEISRGELSFSSGKPVQVSKLDTPCDAYFIVDGHHRAIEAIMSGRRTIAASVDPNIPRIERTGGAHDNYVQNKVNLFARMSTSSRSNPSWGPTYKFEGTDGILEGIQDSEPDDQHVAPPPEHPDSFEHRAIRVTWIGSPGYLVRVPVKNILFMEGNLWNFGHARALLDGIRDGSNDMLEAPAGRVYRVTADRVKSSQRHERDGDLAYQLNMTEPWTRAEQGEYYAQLLDGNHRAAAAMLAGEPYVYVHVSENTRENVYKKDFE